MMYVYACMFIFFFQCSYGVEGNKKRIHNYYHKQSRAKNHQHPYKKNNKSFKNKKTRISTKRQTFTQNDLESYPHVEKTKQKQSHLSLKTLVKQYGLPTAYALQKLSLMNFTESGEYLAAYDDITKKELINTLEHTNSLHPIHFAQLVSNHLPDITIGVAQELYNSMPFIRYRLFHSIPCSLLRNARLAAYNPHNSQITAIDDNTLCHWNQNRATDLHAIDTGADLSKITKMMYHPTIKDEIVTVSNQKLKIYTQNADQVTYKKRDFSVKDFIISPTNSNQIMLIPQSNRTTNALVLDLAETTYKEDTSFSVSPNYKHVTLDLNHNRIGIIGNNLLHLIDAKTNKTIDHMKLKKNNGPCAFDPHHPDIFAYISNRTIRFVHLPTHKQFSTLVHKSDVMSFDFDPHNPYCLISTQKNGETQLWSQLYTIPYDHVTLPKMTKYLEDLESIQQMNKQQLKKFVTTS